MDGLTFDDLKLFARVASLGTLSAVARERDVPVSQVSRTIARIEKTAAVKLMHRSTHALALTPEGETFLDYCHRITGSLDELEGEFNAKSREASGLVRVAASTVMAQYRLVTNSAATNLNLWPFVVDGQAMALPARGFWRTNDTAVAANMVLMGLGIGRLSTIAAEPLVKEGRLVPVMPDLVDRQPSPVYAVTAGTRHRLPKIKACIDYWVSWFAS